MKRGTVLVCVVTLAIAGCGSSLLISVAAAAQSPDQESEETRESKKDSAHEDAKKETTILAEGEGRDLVLTKCSVCHEPERVTRAYRDEQGWTDLVANMVSRGAEVTPEEAKTVVAYLFEHYGIH
jgi:mono/diheme cytochrome c family protein